MVASLPEGRGRVCLATVAHERRCAGEGEGQDSGIGGGANG